MNLYDIRMRQAGMPNIPINRVLKLKNKKDTPERIANFVIGSKNVVVIGKDHYLWVFKMMRLSMAHNLTYAHKFVSASEINMPGYYTNDLIFDNDIICIHSIANCDKNKVHAVVAYCLSANKKILLSSSSLDDIQNTFTENWESIDNNFEVMKV